jgi:predicted O-methyltransferase YrrM
VDLEALLADPPAAHVSKATGKRLPWQIAPQVLELIDASVGPESRTLETGAGVSTALFASKGCEHTCVVPWTSERDRLLDWGERAGVSFERVAFECEVSERVLPRLEPSPLDFVLIDGGHGFPTPFIDFYYAGLRLRAGGLLAVDDTHIWTGRVLHGFLKAQPDWELVRELRLRSSIFRRTSEPSAELEEWNQQPFVVRHSFAGGLRGAVRKGVRGAERGAAKLRRS